MDMKLKVGVYNKVINALKKNPNIDEVEKVEEQNCLVVTSKICGGIKFEFKLMLKGELLILKSEAETKVEGEELAELASEIVESTEIRHTESENKVWFQFAYPFASYDGVDGQKHIFNETMSFIQLMCRYKDSLGCSDISTSAIDMDFTTSEEDDPYGFNDYSDKEEDDNIVASSEFEDDIFEIPKKNEEEVSEDNVEDELFNIGENNVVSNQEEDEIFGMKKTDNKASEMENPDFNEIKATLNDLEKRKQEREARRKERQKRRESSKNTEKKETEPNTKTKQNEKLSEKGSEIDMDDIFGNIFDDEEKDEKQPENSVKTGKSKRSGKKVNSESGDTSDNNNLTIQPKPRQTEKQVVNKNDGVGFVNYERAPEVVEQMNHLYSEMDQVFAQRKKQADYREKTLDEFSERLDRREKEIAVRADRLEANYKEKQTEIEKMKLDMQTQRNEIDFQWEKLKMEQDMLSTKQKDFEESKEIFERTKELEQCQEDSDDQISFLNTEIKEKDEKIEELELKIEEIEKENEEQTNILSDKLSELSNHKNKCDDLEDNIFDMQEEINDLNEEIADLTNETGQQSKLIEILKKQLEDMHEKEKKWKKETKKLAESKADSKELTELQDALDEANMKIKELEASNELSEDVENLKRELALAKSDLEKAEKAYEKEKKEKEDALSLKPSETDNNKKAVEIKDSLSEIGIDVEPVATNGELILSGFSDTSQVIINVDAGVLYVSKPVKRGISHRATFEKWNQEDIRISYLFSDKNVICKCVYDDVAKAALDIINKFNQLK